KLLARVLRLTFSRIRPASVFLFLGSPCHDQSWPGAVFASPSNRGLSVMRFVTALRPAVLLGMALCTVLLMTARLSAQEESADTPSPESPKPALREQTIYVPYNKLRTVFEKEGRGVFVPYEKFQELWRAAQQAQRDDPEPRPPVDALIAEIDS